MKQNETNPLTQILEKKAALDEEAGYRTPYDFYASKSLMERLCGVGGGVATYMGMRVIVDSRLGANEWHIKINPAGPCSHEKDIPKGHGFREDFSYLFCPFCGRKL